MEWGLQQNWLRVEQCFREVAGAWECEREGVVLLAVQEISETVAPCVPPLSHSVFPLKWS